MPETPPIAEVSISFHVYLDTSDAVTTVLARAPSGLSVTLGEITTEPLSSLQLWSSAAGLRGSAPNIAAAALAVIAAARTPL